MLSAIQTMKDRYHCSVKLSLRKQVLRAGRMNAVWEILYCFAQTYHVQGLPDLLNGIAISTDEKGSSRTISGFLW